MYFDTHAHYTDEDFDADREETIKAAYDSGVELIMNASSDFDSSLKALPREHSEDETRCEGVPAANPIRVPATISRTGLSATTRCRPSPASIRRGTRSSS